MRRLLVIAVLLLCAGLLVLGWLSDPAVDVLGERHRAERAGGAVTWHEVLPAAAGEGTRTALLLASAGPGREMISVRSRPKRRHQP